MGESIEDRVNRIDFLFDEFREKFSAFMGALKGDDGQGGILSEIRDDLEDLKVGIRHIDEKQTSMATQIIMDRAQNEKSLNIIKGDINRVGEIARGAARKAEEVREELKVHLEMHRDEQKYLEESQNEKKRFSINTLIAALAVLVAVIVPLITG